MPVRHLREGSGQDLLQGQEINFTSSKEALENGVSMVHQELNLVLQTHRDGQHGLGRYPTKGLFVDHGKMYQDTKHIFEELDIDIDPRVKVGTLSVSQMQMIEIAKAFSYDAKIVIMDEPTSSLTEKEVNHLSRSSTSSRRRGAVSFTSPTRWKRSSSSVTRSPYCGMASGWRPSPQGHDHGSDHRHDGRPRAHPALPGKPTSPKR